MNPFTVRIIEARSDKTHKVVCTMPRWVWEVTKPEKPLGFLGGYILMSYQMDPENKKSGLWHLWDAFRGWRWARKGEQNG